MTVLSQFTSTDSAADVRETLNDLLTKYGASRTALATAQADITSLKARVTSLEGDGGETTPDPGSGSAVVYGPTTTGDSGLVAVGSQNQRFEHPYTNGVVAGLYMFGLDSAGNGVALVQRTDRVYAVHEVVAFSVGDPNSPSGDLQNSSNNFTSPIPDGSTFAVEVRNGALILSINGVQKNFTTPDGSFDVSGFLKGNNARYTKHAGSVVTNLQIKRL